MKLVILDRDGVLNEESPDFIKSVAEWKPIPGSLEAVARLCHAGFRVFVAEEPGELVLIASWSAEAAMREHYDSPHYRHYREQVGPLLARPSDVVVYYVSGTVHVSDPNPPDPGLLG